MRQKVQKMIFGRYWKIGCVLNKNLLGVMVGCNESVRNTWALKTY